MIKSYKFRRSLSNAIIYIILTVMAIVWVLPLFWLVLSAFRADKTVYPSYVWPPNGLDGFTIQNFVDLFTETTLFDYPKWFFNTLFVSVCSCILSTLSVLMVSYTFSRLRFKARKKFMNIAMILGMFPGFMTMIAIYYLLKAIGLTKSLVSLIIVYSAGAALGYFISKGFFDTIPRALDEAATIDGANKNQIFWKIILPMSKPIVVYTALTAFTGPWADFILVSMIMRDEADKYTIAMGLYKMIQQEYISTYIMQFYAGALIIAIPITALFLWMQKYYVEGVTGGAVKG